MARFCTIVALASTLIVSACADTGLQRAPAGPDKPWQVPNTLELPASKAASVTIDAQQELGLAQLIDIAQRENPLTRQAWNAARSAALGVGMVEATFLPRLSANVIAGRMDNRYPLKHSLLGVDEIKTKSTGSAPFLALTWLLFDFGQRQALLEAAEQASFASNVLFNASHQQLIQAVTTQYYQYLAAQQRAAAASQNIKLQQQALTAAQARYRAGFGTTLDVSLAQQALAQAKLQVVTSQGLEKTTKLELLGAMGLPADTAIKVAAPPMQQLPTDITPLTQQALQQALSQRPDVLAQYAALRAAQANIKAAEADFLPKVFLGGIAGSRRSNFQLGSLPGLEVPASGNGIAVGVHLPIFDGGIRRNRLRSSEIAAEQAQNSLASLQRDAIRQMLLAQTALETNLQAYITAQELVKTARTAYNGALAAYQEGLGTITVATEAASQLLQARQARVDARTAALVAAANLAFAMGAMVHAQEDWLP